MQVEKTVFISYRRTNAMTGRAVYQNLTMHGYDCFFDYESIDSGSFERIILDQIAARAHFVAILTPSALEHCKEPDDWLRREIEYALEHERNIVPLMFDGFRYSDVQKYLTGKLDVLPQYNALEIPSAYFEEAMTRLQTRFLSKPLNVILRPTPKADRQVVEEAKARVESQPAVSEERLNAEEWFERGLKRAIHDYDGAITDYNEAIRLNPKYADAYNNRGRARHDKGDYDGAITDYNEAIRLNPKFEKAYKNRAGTLYSQGDYNSAITDYNEAIHLNPNYSLAYNNRGLVRHQMQDYDGAITDYNEAIRLNPSFSQAYNNRGWAHYNKGDYNRAIADYTQSIGLKNPAPHVPYNSRGLAHYNKLDYYSAIADYNEAIRLSPIYSQAYHNRGTARKDNGDLKGAILDYTRAIELNNPDLHFSYHGRGVARYSQGDYNSAIADYETALRINPNYAAAKQNLELARKAKAEQHK